MFHVFGWWKETGGNPGETHTDTGKTHKLHTESDDDVFINPL